LSPVTADDTDLAPAARPPLFGGLQAARSRRAPLAAPVSIVVHTLALLALVAVSSRLTLERAPARAAFSTILYHPAPPPALPLPKGDGEGLRTQRSPVVVTEPQPVPADTSPVVEETPPPAEASSTDSAGSATGSEHGSNLGMEGGRDGGEAGGMPWGVVGGVPGGAGTEPVANPDQQPRIVRKVAPIYPHEAFVQKIQGKVVVEIVIDDTGRVVHTRVIEGVPALNEAALTAVRQWVFAPAVKNGRPVASRALAPVGFQIF
jgi:periplasmic protein TonB